MMRLMPPALAVRRDDDDLLVTGHDHPQLLAGSWD